MQPCLFLVFLASVTPPPCSLTAGGHAKASLAEAGAHMTTWAIVVLGLSALATGSRVRASYSPFPTASYSCPQPLPPAQHLQSASSLSRSISASAKSSDDTGVEVHRLGRGDAVRVTAPRLPVALAQVGLRLPHSLSTCLLSASWVPGTVLCVWENKVRALVELIF